MKLDPKLFRPKLLDTLSGYDRTTLTRDVGAGLTVGVVALPLAMAFAIASGLKPEAGLFTAIIAGFLISLLGGSRVQIGGPAGAFIVIVYGILERYGLANLILATAMSGMLLFLMGLFRLGSLIRFIPVAVVIGFTNGIAVLIMLSQVKDLLGLKVTVMPADFFGMLHTLAASASSVNLAALLVALGSLSLLVGWMRLGRRLENTRHQWLGAVPGSIIALLFATFATAGLSLPVDTIGSKFGGIPASLPHLQWPEFSWDSARFLFMPTMTLALLGAIESLLCARIADGLTEDRHNPNQELMAQGLANLAMPFMGGMPATGTIARTVTNVKNGASSPVAGMVHALGLLLMVLLAAPLVFHIPLGALSAILMLVAYNMGEWRAFAHLSQFRWPYRLTLLAVFALTVLVDLTVAIEVGLIAACLTLVYRISGLTHSVKLHHSPQVQVWGLQGALFFGAIDLLENISLHLPQEALVLECSGLIYMDSSGADALHHLWRHCQKAGVRLVLTGLNPQARDLLHRTKLLTQMGEANVQPHWAPALQTLAR